MLLNEMFEVMKKMEQLLIESNAEIERLKKRLSLSEQYIDIYEEYIKKGVGISDNDDQSRDICEK